MLYKVNLVTIPLSMSSMKYFVHKNMSIEASSTLADKLFQDLMNDIPALAEHIKYDMDHRDYLNTTDLSSLYIVFDFSEYEEILLYYKLAEPKKFDKLLSYKGKNILN